VLNVHFFTRNLHLDNSAFAAKLKGGEEDDGAGVSLSSSGSLNVKVRMQSAGNCG